MREHNRAVRKAIPKPIATNLDYAGDVPGVEPISDDGSVDSLLFSRASESEGDILGNNYDNDASNAHEGANLVHPISMEMREYSRLLSLSKLLRELLVELVGKQKSIYQPCGAVVLMANWSTYH
jgi:hypothetical protein